LKIKEQSLSQQPTDLAAPVLPSSDAVIPESTPKIAWIGYVVPMALFMVLTMLEGSIGKAYVWLYMVKVIVVSGSLLLFRGPLRDYRFEPRVLLPALLVGLVIFGEWILISPHTPALPIGKRVAFDPTTLPQAQYALFLIFRLFGLAVMVPLMEELFWRSFLIRFITTEKFLSIPPWAFSWGAFAAIAVAFAFSHPEWLPALICAVAYGLLLRQTKSLFACLIAHSVTNLTLGLYVLATHNWIYW
jgi:CAAX prenyl protease-like protein